MISMTMIILYVQLNDVKEVLINQQLQMIRLGRHAAAVVLSLNHQPLLKSALLVLQTAFLSRQNVIIPKIVQLSF